MIVIHEQLTEDLQAIYVYLCDAVAKYAKGITEMLNGACYTYLWAAYLCVKKYICIFTVRFTYYFDEYGASICITWKDSYSEFTVILQKKTAHQ